MLGPLLFILYTTNLIPLIEDTGFSSFVRRRYSGAWFLHVSCGPIEIDTFTSKLSECVGLISNWMHSNRLQLNLDKTGVIWCTTGRCQHQLPTHALLMRDVPVIPVTSARNLGILIDDADTRSTNSIRMLCCAPSTATDPQLRVDCHVPSIGGRSGVVQTELWQPPC